MSSYIYPAYLYKDNAKFEDVEKLIKELRQIREQFVDYVVKEMLNTSYIKSLLISEYFTSPEEYYNNQKIFELRDQIKKDTSSYERGMLLDCSCNVTVYFHNYKIVVHEFSSSLTKNFLKEKFKYPDYSLYDIYAGDDEVTEEMEKEYSEKKDFYNSLFSDTGIPSNVGLVFEFYKEEYIYDIEDRLADEFFGKDWYKKLKQEKLEK